MKTKIEDIQGTGCGALTKSRSKSDNIRDRPARGGLFEGSLVSINESLLVLDVPAYPKVFLFFLCVFFWGGRSPAAAPRVVSF